MVKLKEHITEQQLIKLLQVLKVHNQLVNKMNPRDIGNYFKQKVFNEHKKFINDLYEELDNATI